MCACSIDSLNSGSDFKRVRSLPHLREACKTLNAEAVASDRHSHKQCRRPLTTSSASVKPFSSSSPLLKSSVDDVKPMENLLHSLTLERICRRRAFTAEEQPVIARVSAEHGDRRRPDRQHALPASRPWSPTDGSYSDDEDSAVRHEARASILCKVGNVSAFFDRGSIPNLKCFSSFEYTQLRHSEFVELVRRLLNTRVTTAEGNELVKLFDPRRTGYIYGPDFVRWFAQCGIAARADERVRAEACLNRAKQVKQNKRFAERSSKGCYKLGTVVAKIDSADEIAAYTKLSRAALNKGLAGDVIARKAFEETMKPAEFKTLFHRLYGVKLTPQEMAAILKRFDTTGSGLIDGVHFRFEWSNILNAIRSNIVTNKEVASKRREAVLTPPRLTVDVAKAERLRTLQTQPSRSTLSLRNMQQRPKYEDYSSCCRRDNATRSKEGGPTVTIQSRGQPIAMLA